MLRPIVRPALDPLAHRAAIDGMEAQRAAYRRFARSVEAQRQTLGDGDGERAVAVVDDVARGFAELERGAGDLAPLLDRVREAAPPDELQAMQRQMDELMHEARAAESAIQNLMSQLQAWRDAYGRQLTELGLAPGATTDGGPGGEPSVGPAEGSGTGRRGYARPGFGRAATRPGTSILDRRG